MGRLAADVCEGAADADLMSATDGELRDCRWDGADDVGVGSPSCSSSRPFAESSPVTIAKSGP